MKLPRAPRARKIVRHVQGDSMIDPRRWLATICFAIAVTGCALGPQSRSLAPAPSAAGYPMDVSALKKDDDDEEQREREAQRAAISAEYNLKLEADENGPPQAWQILRAYEQ